MSNPTKITAALRQSDDPYGLTLKSERPDHILVINYGSSSVKYAYYGSFTTPVAASSTGVADTSGGVWELPDPPRTNETVTTHIPDKRTHKKTNPKTGLEPPSKNCYKTV